MGFLFNTNVVPLLQVNIKYERILCVSTDRMGKSQITILIESDLWNSVSMFPRMTFSAVPFEGQHTGPSLPSLPSNVGLNDQIKTDPEKWTPVGNCSNLVVFLNFTPRT